MLHLQILLTFTCTLLGFSEMFHKWLFDFPKVLVNLIGLGRMMLASLNLIKPGTVHWISQALNMNLLKMARCCSVLTLVRKIKKGELGSMINWDSHLVDYYLTLWSYISKSLWAFNSSLQSFLIAQSVKNLPARQKNWVWFLGQKDPLEKAMATHSSILAWRIPWMEEPGGL